MIVLMHLNLLIVRYVALELDSIRMESIVWCSPFWNLKESIQKGRVLWSNMVVG